jgi:glycosyltransferase involved in cell wall biosynthesis
VARAYAENHENITLVRNEKNMGLNYTLNRCLEYADTEYCARMDGDDISLPTRFEKEIKFLDAHPEYAIVSTQMQHFDAEGVFRVGKGKGEPEYWAAVVRPGTVMYEVAGVPEETAKLCFNRLAHKMPVKCRLIRRKSI